MTDAVRELDNASALGFIEEALSLGAIRFPEGGYPLSCGRVSPYVFDAAWFNSGTSTTKLAEMFARVTTKAGLEPQIVFGPPYKGIPIAVSVAPKLGGHTCWAYNRKEEKDHGEGGIIVSGRTSIAKKRVLIVDDVMTTGKSISDAVELIQKHGGVLIGCVVALDRQEQFDHTSSGTLLRAHSGKLEFERRFRVPVLSIATFSDLLTFLRKEEPKDKFTNHLKKMENVRKILPYWDKYRGSDIET